MQCVSELGGRVGGKHSYSSGGREPDRLVAVPVVGMDRKALCAEPTDGDEGTVRGRVRRADVELGEESCAGEEEVKDAGKDDCARRGYPFIRLQEKPLLQKGSSS